MFRNIKVTAPDGTVLWEGPPELHERRAERQADVDGISMERKPSRTQPNGSTVPRAPADPASAVGAGEPPSKGDDPQESRFVPLLGWM